VLLFVAVLISACVTSKSLELPELSDWESRQNILVGVDEWEFDGRIGVSAGDEGFNGQLRWRQDGVVFRARINGPLGAGTVFINGDRRKITVTDRQGTVTELHDAEAELRQMYGWTIPVTSLRFWALGIPDPASPAETEFGEDGQLSTLRQQGWQVEFTQYREGGGQLMPRRLTAVNDDVKVRLVIDNWTFR
jgi:outer membrane lipoprotein LolB